MAVAFPAFASAFVNVKTLEAYEPEEEERVLKTTSGVNVAMLKLGAMLRECAGDAGRMETTLRTLASGFTELPTMPQLMGLLRTEEGPRRWRSSSTSTTRRSTWISTRRTCGRCRHPSGLR